MLEEHDALARRAQPKRLVSKRAWINLGIAAMMVGAAVAAVSVRSCSGPIRCQSAIPNVCPP